MPDFKTWKLRGCIAALAWCLTVHAIASAQNDMPALSDGSNPSAVPPTTDTVIENPSPAIPELSDRTEDEVTRFLAMAPAGDNDGIQPGLRIIMSNRLAAGESLAVLIGCCACLGLLLPGYLLFYSGLLARSIDSELIGRCAVYFALLGLAWVLVIYSLAFARNAHTYDVAQRELQVMDRDGAPGNLFIGDLSHAGFNDLQSNWSSERLFFPLRRATDAIPHIYFLAFQMTVLLQAVAPLLLMVNRGRSQLRTSVWLLLWSTLIYAPLCFWVQGGGWLADCLDTAGATATQLGIGFTALGLMLAIRSKDTPLVESIGWTDQAKTGSEKNENEKTNRAVKDREAKIALDSSRLDRGIGMLIVGSLLLAASRSIAFSKTADPYFLNVFLAGATGLLMWMGLQYRCRNQSWSGWQMGCLSGIVSMTAAGSHIAPISALLVGLVSSLASFVCIQICAPAALQGVSATHSNGSSGTASVLCIIFSLQGVAAMVGLLMVGVLATPDVAGADSAGRPIVGTIAGNFDQLRVQLVATAVMALTSMVGGWVLIRLIDGIGSLFDSRTVRAPS